MKLLKVISIVLCILSPISFATEIYPQALVEAFRYDLIDLAKTLDSSKIIERFEKYKPAKSTGLFTSVPKSDDVVDFLDTRLVFKVCSNLGFFNNYLKTLPKEKLLTFYEDLDKKVLLTFGLDALIYFNAKTDLNSVSNEEYIQFTEDFYSLLNFYNFATYKIINDYNSLQYQGDRNLSKYTDRLQSRCDLEMSSLKKLEGILLKSLELTFNIK